MCFTFRSNIEQVDGYDTIRSPYTTLLRIFEPIDKAKWPCITKGFWWLSVSKTNIKK
ncbi:hypothetical protein GGD38_003203 [Chitinophagaceae bacterium OAS944]|nr:hypothetical protein [Chitinophagaceae bacterium OAS944]